MICNISSEQQRLINSSFVLTIGTPHLTLSNELRWPIVTIYSIATPPRDIESTHLFTWNFSDTTHIMRMHLALERPGVLNNRT